jgi:hypothetical protein
VDLTDLDIHMTPPGRLHGHLVFDTGAPPEGADTKD